CNTCMIDFNADSPAVIEQKMTAYAMKRYASIDTDGEQLCRSSVTCYDGLNPDECLKLVKIARAAVLTTKWRQSQPELQLLTDELREAGLL
ncbi:MAG: hypothetical protein ACOYOU_22125, partial [Kiritimatiellia bacterium]